MDKQALIEARDAVKQQFDELEAQRIETVNTQLKLSGRFDLLSEQISQLEATENAEVKTDGQATEIPQGQVEEAQTAEEQQDSPSEPAEAEIVT